MFSILKGIKEKTVPLKPKDKETIPIIATFFKTHKEPQNAIVIPIGVVATITSLERARGVFTFGFLMFAVASLITISCIVDFLFKTKEVI